MRRHVCSQYASYYAYASSEVISAISCDVAMLEMGEDEGGAGDVADFAGACGDVLEGAPAADEQGEPAFAETAQ